MKSERIEINEEEITLSTVEDTCIVYIKEEDVKNLNTGLKVIFGSLWSKLLIIWRKVILGQFNWVFTSFIANKWENKEVNKQK